MSTLTLTQIVIIVTTHHKVIFQDRWEFNRLNINALVEKWMPCDTFMSPRFFEADHVMRLKGNEEYDPKRINKINYMLPKPTYENRKI